ncbi:MAG TPA: dihydroorotate dehydrogenase electron transfer subunit [Clostridiales bacterium]|nr:dihydroorotate dehydrogenase electron transfer subunit [Clostridiales bacterium]
MKVCRGIVLSNDSVGEKYYHLKIHCPEIAQEVKEGQIIHVRCTEGLDPLLRRPFSIYRFNPEKGEIELLYILKGKGTELMRRMQKGDAIDLLGPGGNFYQIDPNAEGIAVIGRGVGIASIVSLAEKARKEGRHVTAVLSAKTELLIFADDFLKGIGCDVHVLSDEKGTSDVENVEKILTESIETKKVKQLFTCGSNRIARLTKELGRRYGLSAFVSLEEHMACGIGVCHGCVCQTRDGYKTICKDGPIFDVNEVIMP